MAVKYLLAVQQPDNNSTRGLWPQTVEVRYTPQVTRVQRTHNNWGIILLASNPESTVTVHCISEQLCVYWSLWTISRFSCEADDNCVLPGYYAASIGNSLPTFRDNLPVPKRRCVITQKNAVLFSSFIKFAATELLKIRPHHRRILANQWVRGGKVALGIRNLNLRSQVRGRVGRSVWTRP
jgi:hypothetical protein